jgi:hypothetical protein
MRLVRSLALLATGTVAGFAAAAALVKRMLPSRGDAESDDVALVAIFDGIDLESRAQEFRGGSMLAWYGGVAVDLREARLAPAAHLDLHALFGGIAVRVPAGWRVESRVHTLLGGVAVDVPEPDDPGAPTLTLDGFAVLGGVAVGTNKPAST